MARPIERLSALALSKLAKRKGVFCDGGGLYLHSDPPGPMFLALSLPD